MIHTQTANCRNCYRCIRTCPVKAIAYRDSQARVLEDSCIMCSRCVRECPQNAKRIRSDLELVRHMLSQKEPVIVSLAPSYAGFTAEPYEYVKYLHQVGFAEIRETAEAAAVVSKQYVLEFAAKGSLITTACPVVVDYVEKYAPQWLNLLAETDSPMLAHAKWIKKSNPQARVVFIGPCYAKGMEKREKPGYVDAVLTFAEVYKLYPKNRTGPASEEFEEQNKQRAEQGLGESAVTQSVGAGESSCHAISVARTYPTEGGVIETTFLQAAPLSSSRHKVVSGLENCVRLLKSEEELPRGYFLELNACEGGCLNGPASGAGSPLVKQERLLKLVQSFNSRSEGTVKLPFSTELLPMNDTSIIRRPFRDRSTSPLQFTEHQITTLLHKIGKLRPEDELNCGACGYTSCRDKAAAVLAGKAELYMCMPYAQTRAESFAHVLLDKTPNAVIAVTEQLMVKEVNRAAEGFYQMDAKLLVGLPLAFLLDPEEFVLSQREPVRKKLYFPALKKTASVSASYVEEHQLYLVILHDLTEQEDEREKLRCLKQETVEMAQKVIENQMRVAQEIAGLLGETTAETKVTLTRMKKLLLEE